MKILLVDAITNGLNQSNVLGLSAAYRRVGDLHTFDYRALERKHGKDSMNVRLWEMAARLKPNLVHLEKCELIQPSTIERIRKSTKARIMQVFPDYRPKVPSYIWNACPFVNWSLRPHLSVEWSGSCHKAGCKRVGFWARGVDPEIFKPYPVEKQYDLVKMGIKVGDPHPGTGQGDRGEFLRALDRAGFQIHLFGQANWKFAEDHQNIFNHRFVDLADFARVVSATKISLAVNTHKVPMYCSWRRVFNTLACGGFLLIRYFPGLETVFRNKEHLVWFESTDEAIELIKHYLTYQNERIRIGFRGRQEVITHHTWDIRVKEMLGMAFENREPQFGRFAERQPIEAPTEPTKPTKPTKPFLTIVTRVRVSPRYLDRNIESVDKQSDQDLQHLLIKDRITKTNKHRANRSLFLWKDHIDGQWVYILDDDDKLTYPDFVKSLKKIVKQHNPHVIMVKAMISEVRRKVLPDPWGEGSPVFCKVSSLNFVVRADVWKKYVVRFGAPSAGDYHFISEVWEKQQGLRVHWWNQMVACAPRIGRDPLPKPKTPVAKKAGKIHV